MYMTSQEVNMFVYISKLLPQFVYPLGLGFILLIFAACFIKNRHKTALGLSIIVLLILFLAGNRMVSASLAKNLEWRYMPPEELPQAEMIVLLGGGTESADYPREMAEVNSAGDRVIHAAWLYKEGAAPYILLSGGNLEFSEMRGTTPAVEMRQLLELLEVPGEAFWIQEESENTYEDAVYTTAMLREKGITRIILVTSAMHMPRSVALFEKQGLEVIPSPTDFTITERSWQELTALKANQILLNIMPNASSLSLTTNVLKEHLGMAVYRMRGWID